MRKLLSFKPSYLVVPYFLLLSLGVVEVWSSSYYFAYRRFGYTGFFLDKEIIFSLASIFSAFFFSMLNYKFLKKLSPYMVVFGIFLLIMVHLFGTEIRGATRWLKIGGYLFEPSAFAEFAILVYLADFISRKGSYRNDLSKGVMPVATIVGIFVVLIALEPDIGTAVLIFFTFLGVIYVFGYKFKHIVGLLLPSLIVFAMLIYSNPQKLQRVVNFFSTHRVNYQVEHSLIAMGSGGILGKGVAKGTYKSLFVPDSYNDFIMAGVGEDFGFVGVCFVILLVVMMLISIFYLAYSCEDKFGSALVFGVGVLLAFQSLINLFTVLHLLPPKGITMPFLSYGGTNLVVDGVLLGMVLSVYRRCPLNGK